MANKDRAFHGGAPRGRRDAAPHGSPAPVRQAVGRKMVRWSHSDETFTLSSGSPDWWEAVSRQREVPALLPILEGRLFFASMKGTPVAQPAEYYVTLNKKLRHVPEASPVRCPSLAPALLRPR